MMLLIVMFVLMMISRIGMNFDGSFVIWVIMGVR